MATNNPKRNRRKPKFNPLNYQPELISILKLIEGKRDKLNQDELTQILRIYPKDGRGYFSKSQLIQGYRLFAGKFGLSKFDPELVAKLRMKPIRTISGVTPVTVLTKPFPCPGKCIFCPNDVKMPKSYISSEPGAQRAEVNHFDPYLQAYNRLKAFYDIGHTIQKVELLVLGGTWSFYPTRYQIWFIKRLFEALNDFGEGVDQRDQIKPSVDVSLVNSTAEGLERDNTGMKVTYNQSIAHLYKDQELPKLMDRRESATWEELEQEQRRNQTGKIRCVGLVLETRPDYINEDEVIKLRRFGCTKTQIGLQSLQDKVLQINERGHDVAASRRALKLLRQAGLKIHVHWMPNLYGSDVAHDIDDYRQMFQDADFKPDEIKIYPCSLIDNTGLMSVYERGDWRPYTDKELLEVITYALTHTPEYCRITRVVRDIPGQEIVTGNKITNFRQVGEAHAKKQDLNLADIRAREIKDLRVTLREIELKTTAYQTSSSTELFLQMVTKTDLKLKIPPNRILAFLRLSLPSETSFIPELKEAAIIREVHVYGQALNINQNDSVRTQHRGLGKKLIKAAEEWAQMAGFSKLAVISAIGTRPYYEKLGFKLEELYQIKDLGSGSSHT